MAHIHGVSIKTVTFEWWPNQRDAPEDLPQATQAAFPWTPLISIWGLSYLSQYYLSSPIGVYWKKTLTQVRGTHWSFGQVISWG